MCTEKRTFPLYPCSFPLYCPNYFLLSGVCPHFLLYCALSHSTGRVREREIPTQQEAAKAPSSMYHHDHPSSRPTMPLARYSSAPAGSFLSSLVDSVLAGDTSAFPGVSPEPTTLVGSNGSGASQQQQRFFTDDSPCLTSESTCKAAPQLDPTRSSYGFAGIPAGDLAGVDVSGGGGRGGGSSLIRHRSSPAGFLSHLVADNGFPVGSGGGVGYSPASSADGAHFMGNNRLSSQLSFSSRQDSLSSISEISIPYVGESSTGPGGGHSGTVANPYMPWDDANNSIAFSAPLGKRSKANNGDIITSAFDDIDSQFNLNDASSLDMATVERLLQIQQDNVACKVRAKRGCATHPRSIAERERRTKISEKLRKLQELVPNMDKQTNTADMLDLAVQHIKTLQCQIQTLKQDSTNCTCMSDH